MALPDLRSAAASVVGWLIVVLVELLLLVALGAVIGFALRSVVVLLLVGGLIWLWFRLKAGPD